MRMKMVYMVMSGTADPTGASVPLHLAANGSLEVGHEVAVVLAGDASDILPGKAYESVEGVGVPPLRDLLAKLREHEVPVFV